MQIQKIFEKEKFMSSNNLYKNVHWDIKWWNEQIEKQ